MRRIIHDIRKQPEEVRRHVLHVLVVIAGIILLLLWIYSLGIRLTNSDTQAKMKSDLKPLSVLKDNMVGGYINIAQPNPDAGNNN